MKYRKCNWSGNWHLSTMVSTMDDLQGLENSLGKNIGLKFFTDDVHLRDETHTKAPILPYFVPITSCRSSP